MDWCRGRTNNYSICEYVEKCNEKIDCTTIDDMNEGVYPVHCVGFGRCRRDDGVVNTSGTVREMSREELIAERDKYKAEADRQYKNNCKLECQIKEMQSQIDCLKAELEEVQRNKQELPREPIGVAKMLIYASGTYETSSVQRAFGAGETTNYDIYSKADLKQIAEHLLVYCNNAEEDQ